MRSFVAVAEAGHLTRASEKPDVSQTAVSGQIKALEDELDRALFDRTSSGMELTSADQRLLAEGARCGAELTQRGESTQGCPWTGAVPGVTKIFVERLWRSVKYERVNLKAYDGVSTVPIDR